MILDFANETDFSKYQCDICIIGSGAAGLALLSQFLGSSLSVLVIESGGIEHESNTQSLYDVEMSGLPVTGATEGRFRVFGGSTTKWGGQALPLMPIDFEKRDWVAHSGWPISYHELFPFYNRAYDFLSVDNLNLDHDLFTHLKTQPPSFDHSRLWYHFSKWSPTPNVRQKYFSNIKNSKQCMVLLHANLTRIMLNETHKKISHIEISSLNGNKATITARQFVICAGGIETPRLLLANNHQQSHGIGNEHDLVGRFFQDHPTTTLGWLTSASPKQTQRLFNIFHKTKIKYSVRCTAQAAWQYQHQTLNMSMGIDFIAQNSAIKNVKDLYHAIRNKKFNRAFLQTGLNTIAQAHHLVTPLYQYVIKGKNYVPNALMRIGLMSEQEPNPESRITLTSRKDALGIPFANIKWQLTDLTRYSIQKFAAVLQHELKNANIGNLEFEPWINDPALPWQENFIDQYHHIGATRMHDSAKHGVVDQHCKIHGLENLYIGSSSVFPTGGHSNPTLTIIALCMRLADHLKLKHNTL